MSQCISHVKIRFLIMVISFHLKSLKTVVQKESQEGFKLLTHSTNTEEECKCSQSMTFIDIFNLVSIS